MYKSLMTDLLSIEADLSRAIGLSARHGFEGVDAGSGLLAGPNLDVQAVCALLQQTGVRPGYVGLSPGRVPASAPDWRAALAELPLVAWRAQRLGFRRAVLVVLPFHETLPFDAAFAEHVRRLNGDGRDPGRSRHRAGAGNMCRRRRGGPRTLTHSCMT